MKHTAVNWIYDQIENNAKCIYEVIEQAKAIEKEQIKDAYRTRYIKRWNNFNAEQYYNETFKSE